MKYNSLNECIVDLEKNGQLIRVKEEIDPYLEMAAIQLHMYEKNGPAILFENIKGCKYCAVSNLFGTLDRSKFLFRENLNTVQTLIKLRNNPIQAIKKPLKYFKTALSALHALPKKVAFSKGKFEEIEITNLPLITHWPKDGGAFITLPQVYSEDIEQPGVMKSNLGMYRIQLTGNNYELNKEIGLHYQLHRGIGVHQSKSNSKNIPLKVSIFVGGLPSHTLAAVMPLPEGISELTFAGILGGKRFRYALKDGYCISIDADFVITGKVYPNENKPEGPFGDHLGYYSLTHDFPLMKVDKVYAKKNAIWPFTVVGRPPQEDTSFGALIHEISGSAIPAEIPGVKEVYAVDEAGVHPLLFAIGSERYTPYLQQKQPSELLTQANHILGTGQLSLAKYLFIAEENNILVSCKNAEVFLKHVFERINFERDLHFQTNTSIDTLDYTGEALNLGSKLIIAAAGNKIRTLSKKIPDGIEKITSIKNPTLIFDGVIMLEFKAFKNYEVAKNEINELKTKLLQLNLSGIVQIVLIDAFEYKNKLNDYLWLTYTRTNPSHDVYGFNEQFKHKHWSCSNALIFDARKKTHHAPELEMLPDTKNSITRFFNKGASLEKWK
ncbi:MAG: UbiD family decarboxylase [Bacteroidetes bacterium]|nr:UbiD family decarboxylase [Bacteroidota bacterium]